MEPETAAAVEQLAEIVDHIAAQVEGLETALPLPPEALPVAGWLLRLLALFARHGYALAFLGAFVESNLLLGILLPGGSVVALAGAGGRTGGLSLPLLVVWGTAGMVAGALGNYALGRVGADRYLRRGRLGRRLGAQLDHAGTLLHRHGWWATLLSYVLGTSRSALAVAAGAGHLPLRRFLAYQVPAALLWSTFFAGGGYAIARELHTIESLLRRSGWLGFVGIAAAVAAWWAAHALTRHRRTRAAAQA